MSESGRFWNVSLPSVRSNYPLQMRDHSLTAAAGLLMRSLPYALARFAVQIAFAVGIIIWMVIAFGGAAWLGAHVASAFGVVWLVVCLVGVGWFWGTVARYLLHLIACGHVAVLTELIMHGQVGNGSESMFAYERRIVTARFGQITLLFGFNALVRGVLNAFHNTLDWIGEMLPIPGLDSLAKILVTLLINEGTSGAGSESFIPAIASSARRALRCRAAVASTFVAGLELTRDAGLTLHQENAWHAIHVQRCAGRSQDGASTAVPLLPEALK
jgi:hypothetical protein